MAVENTVTISVRGDFGNPNGTGMSKMTLSRVQPGTALSLTTLATLAGSFHAALISAQLTATTMGDLSLTSKSPDISAKPGADVNIDRILVVEWRLATDSSIHSFSLPGVPATSTGVSDMSEGERLNDTGKAALAAAIEGMYDLTAGDVVVLSGKVIQKK